MGFFHHAGTVSALSASDLEIGTILTVDSVNSRVGVGTTSPGATLGIDGDLHFQPTVTSTSHITTAGSLDVRCTDNMRLGTDLADSIRIGRVNTSAVKVHIRSGADTDLVVFDGKVGIGMDDPSDALEIDGDIQLTPTASSTAHLKATGSLDVRCDNSLKLGTDGADSVKIGRTNTSAAKVHLQSGATTDLVVFGNKVGIGTETPSATLEVTNASDAGAPLLQLNSNDTDQIMMDVNAANINANVIDITADGVTTSDVLFISMDGATGGSAIAVEDGSASTAARDVVEIKQTSTASVNATTFSVESQGGKIGQYLGKSYAHTSAATVKGLWLNFDKTAATTTDNTLVGIDLDMDNTSATNGTNTMVGISVTPTLTHAADAGTTTVKGIAITATGGTNGSSVTTGLDLTATGADTNIGISTTVADGGTDIRVNSSADTGDYCSISTTTHGATTIATVDDDAAAAHLTLDVDGNITLDADGGTVTFADGGSSLGTITSSGITTAGLLGAAGVAAGGGVSGAGSLATYVAKINGEFVTTILVDIAGLIDSGYNNKVIGDSDEAAAYLTQLTSTANGLIYKIEMSCIEAPTTGNADINLYANPSSLAEGATVTSGGELLLDSNASWSLGRRIVSPASGSALANAVTSAASQYIYLAQGTMGGSSDATYGAGKFIIKFYGTAI